MSTCRKPGSSGCQSILAALASLLLALAPVASAGPEGEQSCRQLPQSQPAEQSAPLPRKLEILSWNIQKASRTGWRQDLARLGGDVDLAFIQEADLHAGLGALLPAASHEAFAEGYTGSGKRTGVMTLSAHRPGWHCSLSVLEPWLRTPKATSVTTHRLAGGEKKLLAVNLHAVNFALGLEDLQRQFAPLKDLIASHEGPVILAGDMNTWSESRQALLDRFALEFGLNPVSFNPDLRSTAFGNALDHIYVRGLRAESATVIPVDSSDHNPLRVSLALL